MRFIDSNGQGVPGFMPTNPNQFVLLFVPENSLDASTSNDNLLASEGIPQGKFDQTNYSDLMTDENGRVTLPALIPGATYKMAFHELGPNKTFPRKLKSAPGENLELPEVVIANAKIVSEATERWKKRHQQSQATESK